MAVNYLTLRSTISYATDGSQAPINSLMAVSSIGVTTWTNRIAISTLTASSMTASTVAFSTMTASTIITAGSTITLAQNASVPNRYVEIGCDQADSMYFDFHSKDSALPDYSTRIQSVGGATTGTGNLNMYASTIGLMGTAGVGIGTTVPSASLHIKNATSAMRITGNLTNTSTRPAVSTTPGAFEIRGSGALDGSDDGFLRLSAGGGNAAYTQTYIDLSGYSTVSDMDRNIIFGTAGAERMRINIYGYIGIGTASPQAPLQVGAGLVTDLGSGLKTQYTQVTSITAASVRNGGDWSYGGTYGGTGPYTWTTNIASGSYFTISTGITAGATYRVSFTASGTAGAVFGFESFSATLTTSLTTYTGLAPNLTSYGLYVNVYGPSGTVFTFSNITFQRLDTLASGFVGIGTTLPSTNLHIYGSLRLDYAAATYTTTLAATTYAANTAYTLIPYNVLTNEVTYIIRAKWLGSGGVPWVLYFSFVWISGGVNSSLNTEALPWIPVPVSVNTASADYGISIRGLASPGNGIQGIQFKCNTAIGISAGWNVVAIQICA